MNLSDLECYLNDLKHFWPQTPEIIACVNYDMFKHELENACH